MSVKATKYTLKPALFFVVSEDSLDNPYRVFISPSSHSGRAVREQTDQSGNLIGTKIASCRAVSTFRSSCCAIINCFSAFSRIFRKASNFVLSLPDLYSYFAGGQEALRRLYHFWSACRDSCIPKVFTISSRTGSNFESHPCWCLLAAHIIRASKSSSNLTRSAIYCRVCHSAS